MPDDQNVLVPDDMEKDVKKGIEMVEELTRILPAAGELDRAVTRDLLLIGRMNGDLYETKIARKYGAGMDAGSITAVIYALSWIEGQLSWFEALHFMYRRSGYSKRVFLAYYREQMDKRPKLDRIRIEDDSVLDALDGLHGRVKGINGKLKVLLHNVRRMRDGEPYPC